MNTLEIIVQRKTESGWPVVVEESSPDSLSPLRHETSLTLTPDDLTALLLRLRDSQIDPAGYGAELGRFLLQGDVRAAFDRARASSPNGMRVLLTIEADDLRPWHWERLCVPDNGHWDLIGLEQRLPFSLYLPSVTDRRFPPISRRDLRALLVVASPEGLDQYRLASFDAVDTVAAVRDALGTIPCDVLGSVEHAVGPPTLDALIERLTATPYSLLHVVAHGRFLARDGDTHLYLADAAGQVERVSGTRLLARLGRLNRLPHLTFLASCESARPEAEAGLGGLAQRLVRELGMPAVVAMTDQVSLTTAQSLASAFYARLTEHGEVDRALVEATAGVAERGDITVPALYSRLGGRPLFSVAPLRLDELTDGDLSYGLDRLAGLMPERAPVLQTSFATYAATVRGTLGTVTDQLSKERRAERSHVLEALDVLCDEVLELSFAALAQGQAVPPYDARCPFRGLYPFRPEDREFFFGRENLIAALRRKVAEHRFLPVLGPSGSGKSSLVLAGLIPTLQRAEPNLSWAVCTPGSDPLARLEAALAEVEDMPDLLVVDQFEELFTQSPISQRHAFVDRVLALA
jgi:hypothetical protein